MTDQADTAPIGEWLAAAEKATQGPWYPQPDDLIGGWCVANVDKPSSQHGGRETGERAVSDFTNEPDAAFIAASRNVVPAVAALADEVRALCAERDRAFTERDTADATRIRLAADLAAARDQIAAVAALADRLRTKTPRPAARTMAGFDAVLQEHDEWVADQIAAALSQSGQPTKETP